MPDIYHELYKLYSEGDVDSLRQYRDLVDLFPPVDSTIALERWQEFRSELGDRQSEIREDFEFGDAFAEIAAISTMEQAFTALDLYNKYEHMVNVLVVDVDETLRSAGGTDNEIPRETLHQITELHESGMPIVVCTGQTLENVKGFTIQGLGNRLVHSGRFSIVYEGGSGVFTPGKGTRTKQLLYEDLDADVVDRFQTVRSRLIPEMPEDLRSRVHLQGNEFNVTVKTNDETGSERAEETIRRALPHLLEEIGGTLSGGGSFEDVASYYATTDPDIDAVLDGDVARTEMKAITNSESEFAEMDDGNEIPPSTRNALEQIDVAYYEADAVEMVSAKLHKVAGVEAAFDILDIDEPFALVLGDSKSDLRVMEWVEKEAIGIAAAPDHASEQVLDHVRRRDDLVYDRGSADQILRTIRAMQEIGPIVSDDNMV
ncbi:MAG: HAD family hydrolase [Halodesulfurarchaeum sp.]